MTVVSSPPFDVSDDRVGRAARVDVGAVYARHATTVARWARRLGGPAIDADDVVQEVFLIAGRKLAGFDGAAKITTWLFRTTERVVLGARRKHRLRRLLAGRVRRAAEVDIVRPGHQPTPLEEVEQRQMTAAIYQLFDRLPERHRQALILFEIEGLTTEEIAALTGVELTTVRVWLHRARTRFAALYAAWEAKRAQPGGET